MKKENVSIFIALLVFASVSCVREVSDDGCPRALNFAVAVDAGTRSVLYNDIHQLEDDPGTFQVLSFNSDHSHYVPVDDSEERITFSSGKWTMAGDAPMWKNADIKTFLAYTNLPEGASVTCEDDAGHTFSYPVLLTDEADQKDALLGYYRGNGDSNGDGRSDGTATLTFVHPLTSVIFKQGDFPGVSALKSITLDGVFDGGTAYVTYSYDGDGNLVPDFDWGTSLSSKISLVKAGSLPGKGNPIGEPMILFPQNLETDPVTVRVIATVPDGTDKEILFELDTDEWASGKTYTYVIGFDAHTYQYEFALANPADADIVFTNTTAEETRTINITNVMKDESGVDYDADWVIKSVKVGSYPPDIINDTKFTDMDGFSAEKDGNTLKLTASFGSIVGSHNYWTNRWGISGDTEGTGWSPKDWSDKGVIDLSTFDFKTETLNNPRNTANCYVIRHAGHYKLPLVYGNALKNGAVNVEAYFPDVTGGSSRLVNFVNSEGKALSAESDAFIENNEGCGGDDLKCAVIWQDNAIVVENLSITGSITDGVYDMDNVRYLQFDISPETVCQNNALICIYKDKDGGTPDQYDAGETIWSWHIWTTNDPALIGEPIHIVNTTPKDYWFFPLYILGWIDSNRYSGTSNDEITLQQRGSGNEIRIAVRRTSVTVTSRSYGTSYQFGRKDPLCTKPDKKPAFGKMPAATSSSMTLQDLVRDPERMPNNVTNWNHYNLWTGRKSVASGSPTDDDEEMIKTIYDPSPVGYKVPGPKAFDRLTKGADLTHGMYYYTTEDKSATGPTIYFPIPYSWYGLSLVNQWGLYWGSVASNSNSAHYWCANASRYYYAESRAYGQHVRPVRE